MENRTFSHELSIPATSERVWRAISDGAELARWFPISARVKPGAGGSIFLSWGPACEGEAPITLWEPGKKFAWQEPHGGGVAITVMFELLPGPKSASGESTVLRVTQSGFGRGAQWDSMYDSISSGWKFELRSLRHYLRRHDGHNRSTLWLPVPGRGLSQADAWTRLTAPRALCRVGSIGGHAEGDPYTLEGPDGRTYSGTIERAVEGRVFAGTVRELDDALIRIELEGSADSAASGGGCAASPTFWLSKWGGSPEEVAAVGKAWTERMAALLAA